MYTLTKKEAEFIQEHAGKLDVDGDIGNLTLTRLKKLTDFKTPDDKMHILAAYIQEKHNESHKPKVVVDGLFGPSTHHALETLMGITGRPEAIDHDEETYNEYKKDIQSTIVTLESPLPKHATFAQKVDVFGHPRDIVGNQGRYLERIKFDAYPMYYIGQRVKATLVHKKAADNFRLAFENIAKAYTADTIKRLKLDDYGGCFNSRRIRGGTAWSSHSFGSAIDMYASHNRMRQGPDTAAFATNHEYKDFMKAFYAAGFTSLGLRAKIDFMHFEL